MSKIQKIAWDKSYEVGNYEIDTEHKIFLKTLKKIEDAYLNGYDDAYLSLLMLELFKYADFHFSSEENLMYKIRYPDIKTHKEEHRELLFQLRNLINSTDVETIRMNEFLAFVFNWFITHTVGSDRKIANYLLEESQDFNAILK